MKKCSYCGKQYKNMIDVVESAWVYDWLQGTNTGDAILATCSCNSTLWVSMDDLMAELFKTKVG